MKTLGVSRSSNEPLAIQLEQIELAIEAASRGEKFPLPFSLDQTFYLLQQEYGKDTVAREVLHSVKVDNSYPIEKHQSILRLARNPSGQTQVVTTNFDLLFKYADSSVDSYIPPALPALGNGEPLDGVVYLHGQWEETNRFKPVQSKLVISSADFGRAYLADGWASTFIKELASHYVIVLLGYSAEDPPVRYLLEGLHAQEKTSTPRIYSFSRGSQEQTNQDWQHRGVTGIAYNEHDDLWDSLKYWADFSDDPTSWYESTLRLAQQAPTSLAPYQRAQVAFTISSIEGAEKFAQLTPPPPAEWLCVFDSKLRNCRPTELPYPNRGQFFSWRETYGIEENLRFDDADAPPSDASEYNGVNYLAELVDDSVRRTPIGLAEQPHAMPTRIFHLARWFIKVTADPFSLWWISRQQKISPQLIHLLEITFRNGEENNPLLKYWWVYLEQPSNQDDGRLYGIERALSTHGWNAYMVAELERGLCPHLQLEREANTPPVAGHNPFVIQLTVPETKGLDIDVPDEYLAEVVKIYRQCLEQCCRFLNKIDETLILDIFDDSMSPSEEKIFQYVRWFKDLYIHLVSSNPRAAFLEAMAWNAEDTHFFGQLRLFAWSHPAAFPTSVIAENLCALKEKIFWDNRYFIEKLISARWQEFTDSEKSSLLSRIGAGPSMQYRGAVEDDFWNILHFSAPLLLTLQRSGCTLDAPSLQIVAKARANENWNPRYEADDALDTHPRVYDTTVDTEHRELVHAPISDVVAIASKATKENIFSRVRSAPFEGLVESRPKRAYRALVHSLKNGTFAAGYWMDLLQRHPVGMNWRFHASLCTRLARLSSDDFHRLRYAVANWLSSALQVVAAKNYQLALAMWDAILDSYTQLPKEKQRSSNPRKPPEYDINRELSRLIGALEEFVRNSTSNQASYERDVLPRLSHMLARNEESRDAVLYYIAGKLEFQFTLYPDWTITNVLPHFRHDGPGHEATWSGFTLFHHPLSAKLFGLLNKDILDKFDALSHWPWGPKLHNSLHRHLIYFCQSGAAEAELLVPQQGREILQRTDDKGRAIVLRQISVMDEWETRVQHFILHVWPRELRLQNPTNTAALIKLALSAKDSFPEAVGAVLPLMTSLDANYFSFHYSGRGNPTQLAEQFPLEMLALLDKAVGEKTVPAPHKLEEILQTITDKEPALLGDARLKRLRRHLSQHPF